ncbi:amidase family protein [Nocardia brasiliensis]|uniref:amidase family protein n=1 Tax=Nocardia brasiliensis TaxID=37326 RepID=UPI002454B2B7|nr:amidase family protein [Nocardia brasiliensis]
MPVAVKDDPISQASSLLSVAAAPFRRKSKTPNRFGGCARRVAVIVGKTNTCGLGQLPFTSAAAFGHTRDPWPADRTPGGSPGGSAAAVAAGLVPAALGSDGAGSIRIPLPRSMAGIRAPTPGRGTSSTGRA